MSCVNCDWCEEKAISEVMRKYGVRVMYDGVSETARERHNSTNLHAEIDCAYIRLETET